MKKHTGNDQGLEGGQAASFQDSGVDSSLAALDSLTSVPDRDTDRTAAGRAVFLSRAKILRQTVTREPDNRHKGWTRSFKKERSPMFTLARIILLAAIALGGTGMTAYAAQESLPAQPLYPIKTWIEDVRLGLSTDPQRDFDLLFAFVEERISEIERLAQQRQAIPEHVATRLNEHMRVMAQVVADLDDPALLQAMEQVRIRSQVQVQRLENVRENAPDDTPALGQATQAMNNLRTMAEGALEDPVTFRERHGANRPDEAPAIPDNEPQDGGAQDPDHGKGEGGPQGPKNGQGGG